MIVKSVVLRCSPERAFVLFTQYASSWWPEERRHTRDAHSEIRLEPLGRFFERARDGTEVELGVVRIFEPPKRLLLDWYPGTGPDHPTRVEVAFEPVDSGTRLTIIHGPGSAGQDRFDRNAPSYASSWDLILAAMAGHLVTLELPQGSDEGA